MALQKRSLLEDLLTNKYNLLLFSKQSQQYKANFSIKFEVLSTVVDLQLLFFTYMYFLLLWHPLLSSTSIFHFGVI